MPSMQKKVQKKIKKFFVDTPRELIVYFFSDLPSKLSQRAPDRLKRSVFPN
jgi:hypothetical protein